MEVTEEKERAPSHVGAASPATTSSMIPRLRKDFRLGTFYMLPLLAEFRDDVQWMSETCRVTPAQATQYRDELLASGHWLRMNDGSIKTSQPWLPLGDKKNGEIASSREFMTMASQLLSRISDDGPCWFEWHTIATTNALKMEFLSRVNQALTEFIASSKAVPAETVLGWAHVSLDSLKSLRSEDEQ